MPRAISVGTRWSILYSFVTLIALSIPLGFVYLSVKRQVERDARLILESYLAEVRTEVEAHPDAPGPAVRAFTARLRRITPGLDYGASFETREGVVRFRVGSLAAQRAEPRGRSPFPSGGDGMLRATLSVPGGVIRGRISNRSFAGGVEQIRRLVFISAPVVVALSALCGGWLARRSLRPIANMTDSARRIGGENLSERIPTRGSDDELDRLAATLNGMFDRIADAMERLRGFSADAAHQLKSPIASLQNEIEVTLEGGELDDATRHLLEQILGQVRELGTSVGAMLRLARSESGLMQGQAVSLDLRRLLDGVVSLFQPMAEERGILLELSAGEPIELRGDIAWLRELFANLVQNAIAHTAVGGRVEIRAESKPGAAEIRVSDTGEGIPPAEHKRIFDRFYRLSSARSVPGSGLGLALAQQIAVAHGGSIQLESELGRGSTFRVSLPRRETS